MGPVGIDLSGSVAVITGGGGVLCSRMAEALAGCGAAVAVLDKRPEPVEAVAKRIRDAGGKAAAVACDVLDRSTLVEAEKTVISKFGKIDLLVNGAGGNKPEGTTSMEIMTPDCLDRVAGSRSFFDLDPKAVSAVFDLNFMGTFLPCQVFAQSMARRKSGNIINISSMNAYRPLTKIPAYSASKSAVSNFTQWFAVHAAGAGIRVNALAPGFFETDQNRALLANPDGSLTERGKKIIAHTPMGRFGRPDDLLGALLWLASDKASGFVTGAVIPVDGGFSAYSGV